MRAAAWRLPIFRTVALGAVVLAVMAAALLLLPPAPEASAQSVITYQLDSTIYNVREGDNLRAKIRFSAPLPSDQTLKATFTHGTSDGTDIQSLDTPNTLNITVLGGVSEYDFQIHVKQDDVIENTESFSITLSDTSSVIDRAASNWSATVRIFNVTVVQGDWTLLPDGVNPGQQFRLLFQSDAIRAASSSNIGDYHTFIQGRVSGHGHADIRAHASGFLAVGSTASTDAHVETATTTYTRSGQVTQYRPITQWTTPVYWLGGSKIADDHNDFWDGRWDANARSDVRAADGQAPDTYGGRSPWTGTRTGTDANAGTASTNPLGANQVTYGARGSQNNPFDVGGPASGNAADPFYGISQIFQRAASTQEPITYSLDSQLYNVREGDYLRAKITFSEPLPSDQTLSVTKAGGARTYGAASDSNDYEFPSNLSVTAPAGATEYDFQLHIIQDNIIEPTERFSISLEHGDSTILTPGAKATAAVRIINVTLVPSDWPLKPSGLNAGDQFRLIFKSDAARSPNSIDLSVFRSFVQDRVANHGHADIKAHAPGFEAVISTTQVNAHVITATSPKDSNGNFDPITQWSTPIYWVNSKKVADDHNDFWDGTWDAQDAIDPRGAHGGFPGPHRFVYTGTKTGANKEAGAGTASSYPLRQSGSITYGRSALGENPIATGQKTGDDAFYGLSSIFEVQAKDSPTCGSYNSDGSYDAHEDWGLAPGAVPHGGTFRLLFATSTLHNAESTLWNHYDTIVRNSAKAGHPGLTDACANLFRAFVSTNGGGADGHVARGYPTANTAVYWLAGEKIADGSSDFYDNTWDSRDHRDERGGKTHHDPVAYDRVWTGTLSNGSGPAQYVGNPGVNVKHGRLSGGSPINDGERNKAIEYRLYAMSPVFKMVKDPKLSLSISPSEQFEGDTGSKLVNVRVDVHPANSATTYYKLCIKPTSTATLNSTTTRTTRDYDLINHFDNNGVGLDANNCTALGIAANVAAVHAVRIKVFGDQTDEPDETVELELRDPSTGVDISPTARSATFTIKSDEKEPTLTLSGTGIDEGGDVTFNVNANFAPETDITVNVNVAEDSDPANEFVIPANEGDRTVVLEKEQRSASFTVPTVDNRVDQPDGTLTATLKSGNGYALDPNNLSHDLAITDDDTRGLAISPGILTVEEGKSVTYRVSLTSRPTNVPIPQNVVVTITPGNGLTVDTDPNTDGNQNTISLDRIVWEGGRTVTVTAKEDLNNTDDTWTISHAADGADYGSVSKTLAAIVTDNDVPHLIIETATLTVPEAGTNTYQVKLATQPQGGTTVVITSDNTDVTVNPSTLTFNASGNSNLWSAYQTVTVSAAADTDSVNDTATLTNSGSGGGYDGQTGTVSVTVNDDTPPSFVFSKTSLTVTEDDATGDTYTVKLNSPPDGGTATVKITSNHGAVTADPSELTFNATGSSLWSAAQTVTVKAGTDTDSANNAVTLTHTAAGGNFEGTTDTVGVTATDVWSGQFAGFAIPQLGSHSVNEGETAEIELTLSQARASRLNVRVSATPLTATGNCVDYCGQTWYVTFEAGETSSTFSIRTIADNQKENAETFRLDIHDFDFPSDLRLGESRATYVSISDSVHLSFGQPQTTELREGGEPIEFTLNATQPYFQGTHGFGHAETSGSARHWLDYRIEYFLFGRWFQTSGGLMPVGENVSVTRYRIYALADRRAESDETATITLIPLPQVYVDADQPFYRLGSPHALTFTIKDPPATQTAASFATATSNPSESVGSHSVTVNLNPAAPAGGLTLNYTVGGTATAGSGNDFTIAGSGALSVSAGAATATIPVTINDDSVDDDSETVILTLTTGTGYSLGATTTHTLTIADNDDPPSLVISPASLTINEGATGSYTVKLATRPTGTVTVSITSNNSDVTVSPASLTFNASGNNLWSAARTVTASAGQDNDYSADSATLTHNASGGGYSGVSGTVSVSVNDDDTPPPTAPVVTIAGGAAITEGGNAVFTVTANPAPAANLTVRLTIADDASSDFLASGDEGSKSVVIQAGQATATHTAATQQDTNDEPNGSVSATIVNGNGYTIGSPSSGTVSVADDDPTPAATPAITISGGAAITEGGTATFTLTATPAPTGTISVNVNVADSGDFANSGQTGSRQVSITSAGTNTLNVTTDNDSSDEADGTISATIAVGSGYSIGSPSSDTVSVADDDPTPPVTVSFAKANYSVNEGQAASFSLTLSAPRATATAVRVGSTDLTATGSGIDYNFATSTITIPAGATSANGTVQTVQDTTDELDETFRLDLDGGSLPAGVTAGSQTTAWFTILDDDVPQVSISRAAAAVVEGQAAQFTLTANPAPYRNLTVNVNIAQVGNFGVTTGARAVTIPTSGSYTLTVATTGDSLDEPHGSVTATINNGSGYAVGSPRRATVVVNDDDPVVPRIHVTAPSGQNHFEGDGLTFTLRADEAPEANLDVTVNVAGGGGFLPSGQTGTRTVTFQTGERAQTFTVTTQDDSVVEDPPSAAVTVTVQSGSGYTTLRSRNTASATVHDNDGLPTLSIADGAAPAGDDIHFVVTLSRTAAHEVRFHWETQDGTAISGDYLYRSVDARIPPGSLRVEFWVRTRDHGDTSNRTFTVVLSEPVGATIADGTATGTIEN